MTELERIEFLEKKMAVLEKTIQEQPMVVNNLTIVSDKIIDVDPQ